jgi:hypothetical protein
MMYDKKNPQFLTARESILKSHFDVRYYFPILKNLKFVTSFYWSV